MNRLLRFAVLGSVLLAAASAQTLVHQWRFGENDSGATNGGTVTTVTDHVGPLDLTASGTVNYSNSTPGTASTLAAAFDSTGAFSSAVDGGLGTGSKFIIEGWVYLNGTPASGSRFLFYNGNASWSGVGLMVNGTSVEILEGGFYAATVGTVNANAWNYVALVYNAGAIQTYLNSDTSPSFTASSVFRDYSSATGNGQPNSFTVGGSYAGAFDELRISTFTGSFSTSMLSYSAISAVPEPSTYAAILAAVALAVTAIRRRKSQITAGRNSV